MNLTRTKLNKALVISFILFLFSTSLVADEGQYIVYETGLVIPSGGDKIFFIFSDVKLENEIEEMKEMREKLFSTKKDKLISLVEFYNVLIALEQLYVLNGYFLTRFIVPPQTIEEGKEIKVIVYPGQIESIDTTQLNKRIAKPITKYFTSLIEQEGLGYPLVERAIIKSRDLPGVDLETTIKAGECFPKVMAEELRPILQHIIALIVLLDMVRTFMQDIRSIQKIMMRQIGQVSGRLLYMDLLYP